jgi:MFS transporter, DHA1 family, inner membrane transport protein
MELTRRQRVLAYSTGAYGLSINAITYLLVPLRADELGAGVGLIGLLVGTKALVETVTSVPLGAFMDRTGPRRSLLLGTAGTAVVALGYVFTSSILVLFLMQVILGLARPLGWVGGQSYAAGMRGGDFRKYDTGRFSFSANLGQIVAPLLAGVVADLYGTQAGFLVIVAYGIVFFAISALLPDVGRQAGGESSGAGFRAAWGLMKLPRVQAVMYLTFSRLWIPAVWSSFYPLYLVTSGASATLAGIVVSAMAVAATVTSWFTPRIAALGTPVMVTALSLGVSCVGVALSPVVADGLWPLLAAALVGFGQGISLPMLISLMSEAAPADKRSLALSLRAGVNQASSTVAPVAIGPLMAVAGAAVGFPVAAVIGVGFLVIAVAVSRRADATVPSAAGPGAR